MNILMTGATGFIGRKLAYKLVNDGYHLVCIKRENADTGCLKEYASKCQWVVNNEKEIEEVFKTLHIDIIIHCATQYGRMGGVDKDLVKVNIDLPVVLASFAEKYNSSLFINTDSFFCKNLYQHIDADIYMPNYTLSKFFFCEMMKRNIEKVHFAFVNMRLEHVYGPNDSKGKFVLYILKNLIKNVETIELSDGEQLRDWIYVDDVVNAFCCIIENMSLFNIATFYEYSVGTGTTTSIREFVELAKQITGSNTELLFGRIPRNKGEIFESCADNSKLLTLGWKPRYDLIMGIKGCIEEMS